ncbi:MAG TPA: hypothetical protein VFS12_04180 [Terriglobia bacterium]|nr:hypothetical protein [Terriglobia bacterium]
MKHYTLVEWVEFARGVLPTEQRGAMQRHLDSPCQTCLDAVAFWHTVLARASSHVRSQPPEATVNQVKALFRLVNPSERRAWPLRLAERIFDSDLLSASAGIRSEAATGRQMVYRFGDCLLDLRMETGHKGISLVGQVLNATNPAEPCRDARVVLWESSTLAETTSNEFGEFILDAETSTVPWVLVEVADHPTMVVALPEAKGSGAWE